MRCGASGSGIRPAAGSPGRSWRCRRTAPAPATPARFRTRATARGSSAFPAPSPDGTRLAWICWDHPWMPWDGAELRVAALDGRGPVTDKAQQQLLMGCDTESVLAPVWRDDRSMYVISDRSGWWNLYVA